jgi:hypothetical protein
MGNLALTSVEGISRAIQLLCLEPLRHRSELFLNAILIILTVAYLIWRIPGLLAALPLVVVQIIGGIMWDRGVWRGCA